MSTWGWLQIVLYIVILLLLVKPLGRYMARVYSGGRTMWDPLLGPLEKLIYRWFGIVRQNTTGRQFGILGEPRVNVLELNLVLDGLR
jgi:K+-transporting ATPase ATPase A chain